MKQEKLLFYSSHAQELQGSLGSKIAKLVELIEYDPSGKCFLVHPIDGYNSTTYRLERNKEFGFRCECQGWQSKMRKFQISPLGSVPEPTCSHVAALYEYFARRNKERGFGQKEGVLTC